MDINHYENNQQSSKMLKSPPATTYNNLPAVPNKAPINKTPKSLSENKLKRLNILTFINGKKEILFTKKASKFEKERIWRQIFQKMLEFGMVSAERDWRYVRDVSFSNWRKRAQKRLKHLSANGHRLNMDECEFLIYDILGQTPDKTQTTADATATSVEQETASFVVDNCQMIANDEVGNIDDESDEYMIDSDDDDDDDVSYDEMLFIPKIVFNDNIQSGEKEEYEHESNITVANAHHTNSTIVNRQFNCKPPNEPIKIEQGKSELNKLMIKNGTMITNVNGNAQRSNTYQKYHYSTAQQLVKSMETNQLTTVNSNNNHVNSANKLQLVNNCDNVNGNGCEQVDLNQSSNRYMNKFRELRLLDLEIENKVLKNRFMKLQVFQLEQSLGLEHCDEVKELVDKPVTVKVLQQQQQFKLASGANKTGGQFAVKR